MAIKCFTTRKGKEVLYDDETKEAIDKEKMMLDIAKFADTIHEEYLMTAKEIREKLGYGQTNATSNRSID